jgi:hypothetical protein
VSLNLPGMIDVPTTKKRIAEMQFIFANLINILHRVKVKAVVYIFFAFLAALYTLTLSLFVPGFFCSW